MVPRLSRSVHARFTVIDGLLPVIEGLWGVGSRSVHARFTLVASNFGSMTAKYHEFMVVPALDSQ